MSRSVWRQRDFARWGLRAGRRQRVSSARFGLQSEAQPSLVGAEPGTGPRTDDGLDRRLGHCAVDTHPVDFRVQNLDLVLDSFRPLLLPVPGIDRVVA